MILFFITVSYILGLLFSHSKLWIIIPISVLYFVFLVYRIGIKKASIAFLTFSFGLTLSFVPVKIKSDKEEYKGIVVDARENYYLFKSGFEKFYVYDRANNKECGDYLSLSGYINDINFTTYESQFNFNEYLHNKGVNRTIEVKTEKILFSNPLRVKQRKLEFLSHFDSDTASLIDAFLFNNKDYDNETVILADSLNVMSLLSMNGVYLYFVMTLIEFLLAYPFKKKTANLISTLFLLPYALFSFTKFGVIRVLFMRILSYINKYVLKRKYPYLSLLSFEILIFLFGDRFLIYQQSFYIGFLISFVLIYIRRYSKKVNKKLLPYIPLLSISFLMLPISINNTNEFHFFTPVFQALLLPIHETFAISSLLSLYTFPFTHYLSAFSRLIRVTYRFLNFIDLSIPCGSFNSLSSYIYYVSLVLLLYFVEGKRYKHLKINVGVILSTLLISLVPITKPFKNAVYFINVGQGDSILIQNKSHAVMIDTGGNQSFDMARETLIPFMHKQQIYKLDALITTHDDFDHNGAKDSLLENFKVDKYLSSKSNFPYSIGEITLTNLNTMENVAEDNDKSLVLSLEFMKKKWLFMGDASVEVEKFLIDENIDVDCDVLKVGHHGSKTSTCIEFLMATTPQTAIISVGANNYYKHPNDEVIERLNKYCNNIRRTDIEGTISYIQFGL